MKNCYFVREMSGDFELTQMWQPWHVISLTVRYIKSCLRTNHKLSCRENLVSGAGCIEEWTQSVIPDRHGCAGGELVRQDHPPYKQGPFPRKPGALLPLNLQFLPRWLEVRCMVRVCLHLPSTSPLLWTAPLIFSTLWANSRYNCIELIFKRYKKRWLWRNWKTNLETAKHLSLQNLLLSDNEGTSAGAKNNRRCDAP